VKPSVQFRGVSFAFAEECFLRVVETFGKFVAWEERFALVDQEVDEVREVPARGEEV